MYRHVLRQKRLFWTPRLFSSQRPGFSTARKSLPRNIAIIASVTVAGYAGFSYGYSKAELSENSRSQVWRAPPEARRIRESDPQPPLSLEEAVSKLRSEEVSYIPGERLGVSHYDVVRVPSNQPVEDDLIHGVLKLAPIGTELPVEKSLLFWGVFDGHVYVKSIYFLAINLDQSS
jgi:hypothetical protein